MNVFLKLSNTPMILAGFFHSKTCTHTSSLDNTSSMVLAGAVGGIGQLAGVLLAGIADGVYCFRKDRTSSPAKI